MNGIEIELFELEGGKLIPTKHCYSISYLKAIMDSHPEEVYIRIYQYLQYMTCPYPLKNPFFNIPEADKESEILKAVQLNVSLDDPLIITAKAELEKLFDSTMVRAYKCMRIGVENISTYVATSTPQDGRDSNIANIMRAIERYPKMREAFDKIESAFIASQRVVNARGGQDLAYDQIGGQK